MKVNITKQNIKDLEVLALHALQDISYHDGGSYVTDNGKLNKRELVKAKRAIEFIRGLKVPTQPE